MNRGRTQVHTRASSLWSGRGRNWTVSVHAHIAIMVAAQAKAVIGIMIFIIALTRHGVGICLPLHSSECFLSRVRPAGTGKESRLGFKLKTKEKAGLRKHPIASLFDFTLDNVGQGTCFSLASVCLSRFRAHARKHRDFHAPPMAP